MGRSKTPLQGKTRSHEVANTAATTLHREKPVGTERDVRTGIAMVETTMPRLLDDDETNHLHGEKLVVTSRMMLPRRDVSKSDPHVEVDVMIVTTPHLRDERRGRSLDEGENVSVLLRRDGLVSMATMTAMHLQ